MRIAVSQYTRVVLLTQQVRSHDLPDQQAGQPMSDHTDGVVPALPPPTAGCAVDSYFSVKEELLSI